MPTDLHVILSFILTRHQAGAPVSALLQIIYICGLQSNTSLLLAGAELYVTVYSYIFYESGLT